MVGILRFRDPPREQGISQRFDLIPIKLAHRIALTFTFLWRELGGDSGPARPSDAGEGAG